MSSEKEDLNILGIATFGSREVSNKGISRLMEEASTGGVAIITKYSLPAYMILPLNPLGMRKALDKFAEVYANNESDVAILLKQNLQTYYSLLEQLEK